MDCVTMSDEIHEFEPSLCDKPEVKVPKSCCSDIEENNFEIQMTPMLTSMNRELPYVSDHEDDFIPHDSIMSDNNATDVCIDSAEHERLLTLVWDLPR